MNALYSLAVITVSTGIAIAFIVAAAIAIFNRPI